MIRSPLYVSTACLPGTEPLWTRLSRYMEAGLTEIELGAGVRVTPDDLEALRKTIKRCPKPTNPRCGCAAHRKLGTKDGSGRWNGLRDVELDGTFALRL